MAAESIIMDDSNEFTLDDSPLTHWAGDREEEEFGVF